MLRTAAINVQRQQVRTSTRLDHLQRKVLSDDAAVERIIAHSRGGLNSVPSRCCRLQGFAMDVAGGALS